MQRSATLTGPGTARSPSAVAAGKQRNRVPWAERWRRGKIAVKANSAVGRAVKAGRLQRGACETCGASDRTQAHHDDYSIPLAVRWLCLPCHYAWHANNDPIWPDATE